MIEIGKYNTLTVLRDTSVGLFLGDGQQEVLLPNKYVPNKFLASNELTVFVYLDHEERPVATTLTPSILLNEFALLKVNYINSIGAFMDWGMEKDILVPFAEQTGSMEVGRFYLMYLYLDQKSNRLVGSCRFNRFLDNTELSVREGEEVDLIVSHTTDLGINVIINNRHKGLLYKNEVYESYRTGTCLKGFIKTIRPDNKIDVSLNKPGFANIEENAGKVLDELNELGGFMGLHDNSDPEDIKRALKMSKKTFKKAIGTLMKQGLIEIKPNGISLIRK